MALRSWLKQSPWRTASVYLVVYLTLELVTYIPGLSPLGITPWNPSAGLSFAFLLLIGLGALPLMAAAMILSELLVRHVAFPWWVEVLEAALICGCYAGAYLFLRQPRLRFNPTLSSIRDLILLVMVAIACAAATALLYVAVLVLAGLLALADVPASVFRYWGGDVIGIMLLAPFLLTADPAKAMSSHWLETTLQAAAIVLAGVLVLGAGAALQQQLFYLLFLPIVWMAVRSGLEAVTAGLVVMQIGLMAALHAGAGGAVDVPAFQAVMLVLSFSGLAIGSLVSERERNENRIRLQQDMLARASRVASMGSLTTSLAHEINQPLTAIGNYARAALRTLDSASAPVEDVRVTINKVVRQVDRAGEIMRGLKQLMQSGRIDLAPEKLDTIVAESLELLEPDFAGNKVAVLVDLPRDLPRILVDRLQIEQVLTNLLRNSLEAIQTQPGPLSAIQLRARALDNAQVELQIADNGPGFPDGFEIGKLGPGQSDKPHGLGIGLTICRSIVEGHGGRLTIERASHGAVIRIILMSETGGANVP